MKTRTNKTNTTRTLKNIVATRRFPKPATAVAIVNSYAGGSSMDTLAGVYGGTAVSIRTLLTVNGITIRPRGRYAKGQFQNV